MNYLKSVSIFVIFTFLSSFGVGAEPINVAIFDSEVDLNHPEIRPFIDENMLRSIPSADGKSNLFQEHIDAMAQNTSKKETHGTLVALDMLRNHSPSNVRFIPILFAQSTPPSTLKTMLQLTLAAAVLPFAKSKVEAALKEQNNRLSEILRAYSVRVTNVSVGPTDLEQYFPKLAAFIGIDRLQDLVFGGLVQIAKENPLTSFTFAAGNLGKNLEKSGHWINRGDLPNALVVGALSYAKIAKFSNYSKNVVDVLADGSATVFNQGTSFASPKAANVLISLESVNSFESGQKRNEYLLEHGALKSHWMREFVRDGNFIPNVFTAVEGVNGNATTLGTFYVEEQGVPTRQQIADHIQNQLVPKSHNRSIFEVLIKEKINIGIVVAMYVKRNDPDPLASEVLKEFRVLVRGNTVTALTPDSDVFVETLSGYLVDKGLISNGMQCSTFYKRMLRH